MLNHLILHGAAIHEKPQDVGEGVFVASIYDPWNNVIGLIAEPKKALNGSELASTYKIKAWTNNTFATQPIAVNLQPARY